MGASKSKKKKKSVDTGQPAEGFNDPSVKKVDPRLPFTNYRQVFTLKNSWKAISRCLEDVAKETFIRHFKDFPDHKSWFPNIKNITDPEVMRSSTAFEEEVMQIFSLFDDVMENIENVDVALFSIKNASQNPKSIEIYEAIRPQFMATVEETLDTRWNDKTAENFNLLYDYVLVELKT